MAGTPSSIQRTSQSFDTRLSAAFLSFAPEYMKNQLELLAQECDKRLERELLPRLQAILCDIDRERVAFEEHKRDAARDLRSQLDLHQFDAAAVDDAVGQLEAIAPRYLALLPRASSLALPVSVPASLLTTSTTTPSHRSFETTEADKVSQTAASPIPATPETSNYDTQCSNGQAKHYASATEPLSLDSQVQAQVIAENFVASCGTKRSRLSFQNEGDMPSKRPKMANENSAYFGTQDEKDSSLFDAAIANRASSLSLPFLDGGEMASKYWIREHLGAMPHTFSPTGSSKNLSQANDAETIVRKHQEIDDDFSVPLPKLRRSLCDRESDSEEVNEKPRRTRRNVPRPDYAEMVANKDPWNAPESDTEPVKTVSKPRSAAPIKRRLTKPGLSSSIKLLDSKK
ncbi:hypothetical protein O1611_g7692 [Lasiodiplodia mahajangana]|uniref:Uncharacterized protein n=1 Tax=Lasiodiplodia mahajangana TaxID=1108764 RepID=A0ACC2JEI0_9PEZI|nr:hypothetical protein O1611_g7692 [Lasiodiplodia mahajangana]